jgi:hypothetical protein
MTIHAKPSSTVILTGSKIVYELTISKVKATLSLWPDVMVLIAFCNRHGSSWVLSIQSREERQVTYTFSLTSPQLGTTEPGGVAVPAFVRPWSVSIMWE